MKIQSKPVSASRIEQIQFVMPQHINGYGRLFGGQLMAWIDVVAGAVARRHANAEVTTASVDTFQFKKPAHVNDMIVLVGTITHVGASSMEVRVDSFVEHLNGARDLVNRAYFTMVALDEKEKPIVVPRLILETEEEKLEWEAGEKRTQLRKQRRIEQY